MISQREHREHILKVEDEAIEEPKDINVKSSEDQK